MIRILGFLAVFYTGALLQSAGAQTFQVTHPMDALTYPEIAEAVKLARAAGHADDQTVYPMITLVEMPKGGSAGLDAGQAVYAHGPHDHAQGQAKPPRPSLI